MMVTVYRNGRCNAWKDADRCLREAEHPGDHEYEVDEKARAHLAEVEKRRLTVIEKDQELRQQMYDVAEKNAEARTELTFREERDQLAADFARELVFCEHAFGAERESMLVTSPEWVARTAYDLAEALLVERAHRNRLVS